MPKFESLRPVGLMVRTLASKVRDADSNPVLANPHNSCAFLDPLAWSKAKTFSEEFLISLIDKKKEGRTDSHPFFLKFFLA